MLGYVRKHARSWITKIIFGLVIVVFIFWGGSSYWSRMENMVAQIDRHIISSQQFSKSYNEVLETYQQRYGKAFDAEMIKSMNLEEKVLDQMINGYIMELEAKRLGIIVTNAEMAEAIQSIPVFMSNGKFDMAAYTKALRYYNLTPKEFEDQQKEEITRNRLAAIVTSNVGVTKKEIEASFRDKNDKFDLNYIRIGPREYESKMSVSLEEIKAYYEGHKESYKIPPKASIAYVSFDVAAYKAMVQVTPDEAREYYDAHRRQLYSTPAKVHARHILIAVPEQADEKLIEQKRTEASKIAEEARSGKDFALLAKKYSQDTASAAQGGDLGFVNKDDMGNGIGNTLYAMKPGEIKGPVQSSFGFHIFKLEEKKEEISRPFDEVSGGIIEALKNGKAKDMAYNEAFQTFTKIYEDPNYDIYGYAKTHNLTVAQAGPFTEEDMLNIPGGSALVKYAFKYPVGEISDVIDTGERYFIFKVTKRMSSRVPSLDEVKDKVRVDLIKEKAKDTAKQKADQLAKLNKNDLAKQKGIKIQRTGLFTLSAWVIPGIGISRDTIGNMNQLVSPKVYNAGDDAVVVWLKERKTADVSTMTEDHVKAIQASMLNMKRDMAIEAFIAQAKERYKIKINKDKLL